MVLGSLLLPAKHFTSWAILPAKRRLIFITALSRFRITMETHLWVYLGGFPERCNWGRKTYPKWEQHYSKNGGPGLEKKEEVSWAPVPCLSASWLQVTVTATARLLPPQHPHNKRLCPFFRCDSNWPLLPYVASCPVFAHGKVTNPRVYSPLNRGNNDRLKGT